MTKDEAITYLNVIWNRYKAEYEIERETLDAYHMAIESLSAEDEQVTGKLKNPCNSLLADDVEECKEQKSKLDLISREWLLDLYDIDTTGFKKPANVPLEVVKQNIKDAPSISIQPKTIANNCDLISRENAIEVANKIVEDLSLSSIDWDDLKSWAKELFDALPSADRPKGEWVDREDSADAFFLYKYECSVCGGKAVFNSTYCPNCGAEMNGE